MAKWISSSTLEIATTAAVLIAAITVIVRGGRAPKNDDNWSAIGPIPIAVGASPSLGDDQTTQAIMIFSDFECPYCRVAAEELVPWLKSDCRDGQTRSRDTDVSFRKQIPPQNR